MGWDGMGWERLFVLFQVIHLGFYSTEQMWDSVSVQIRLPEQKGFLGHTAVCCTSFCPSL